jgi:hypothetical protein
MPERFILDANVLYSARLRDLFLQLRRDRVALVYWTDRIEEEWTTALVANRPELQDAVERTAEAIRSAFPSGYIAQELIDPVAFGLPDPKDEHVAQAALTVSGHIVTLNTSDFPARLFAPHALEAVTPDVALLKMVEADPEGVLSAVRTICSRLRNPPVSMAAYLEGLAAAGCPEFGARVRVLVQAG